MLYKIPLTIKTLSPIVISENSGDNVMTGTYDYISGTILRGALASLYIKNHNLEHAESDETFYKFFLSNKLHYLPAYPIASDGKVSMPIALSLQVNKEGTKLVDLTVDSIMPSLKGIKGFGLIRNGVVTKVSPKKEIDFHMARRDSEERIIGSSREGTIYNYEYLQVGQSFATYIVGEKEVLEELKETLDGETNADGELLMYVGRSKHTQYGKCAAKLGRIEVASKACNVTGNSVYLYAFSDYLPNNSMFATVEEALLPLKETVENKLHQHIGIGKVFSSVNEQENFVSVWGVKRPSARSLSAGTLVQLIKDTDWTENEVAILQELGEGGFGSRVVEGFGVFKVWNSITEKVDNPIRTEANTIIQRPKEFSNNVKATINKVILNIITERLQKVAYDDISLRFKNTKPGKHALARVEEIISKAKDSKNIQNAIIDSIREHGALKSHLQNAVYKGVSLFEIFENPKLAPYYENWNYIVDSTIIALAKDVGCRLPDSRDDEIYYIYWLWYCRIARKNMAGRKEAK